MNGLVKYRLILLPLLMICSGVAHAGLYRWVDEEGKVHYADRLPLSVAAQEHSELDERGEVIRTVSAQPTPEQAAARKRQETLLRLRESIENRQQEQDKHLLANYADIGELEAVFNSKLAVLEKNTRVIRERRGKLGKWLSVLKSGVEEAGHGDERNKLEHYIQEAENILLKYDHALQDNQTEYDRLNYRFEQERQRLQRLLSDGSPSSPHPDPSIIPVTLRAGLDRQ